MRNNFTMLPLEIGEISISTKDYILCFNEYTQWHISVFNNTQQSYIYIEEEEYWDILYDNVSFGISEKQDFSEIEWKEILFIINLFINKVKSSDISSDIDIEKLKEEKDKFFTNLIFNK